MTMSKHFRRTGRTTSQYGSFVMDSATAALFAGAILELNERSIAAAAEAKRQTAELNQLMNAQRGVA
jgi:hypothetical protein